MSAPVEIRDGRPPATLVKNLPSLTGLRWLAAFVVFGYHLTVVEFFQPGQQAAALLGEVFGPGSVGVSFFFILSGLVLLWSSPRTPCRRFWWRRFARVYPLHAVTAATVLALLAAGLLPGLPSVGAIVRNLLLVQAWSWTIVDVQSLNTVSWTLSCEAFFYLSFPLLAAGVVRLSRRHLRWLAGGMLLVIVAGPVVGTLLAGPDRADWFFHWNPLGRLPEFVLGMTLAGLVRSQPSRHSGGRWALATVLTVGGYLLTAVMPPPLQHAACTAPGFALLLTAAAASDLADRQTVWRHRLMVRLGEMSFAFYLVHLIVFRLLEWWIGFHPHLAAGKALAAGTAAFVGALAASWLLHRHVERPARTLLLRSRFSSSGFAGVPGR